MNAEAPVIAGIDVHKMMLAVVVARFQEGRLEFIERQFPTSRYSLEELASWLRSEQVTEIAMESTAQYWVPVWRALEDDFKLHLAQPRSTAAPKGRKSDFADARRIVKRLLAGDLTLSYVPEREQRQWRLMTRQRVALVIQQGRVRNQLEGLLEQARIKLSGVLSDLVGASGRRILWAMAKGGTDRAVLAALADSAVKATPAILQEALRGELSEVQRMMLRMSLEQWDLLHKHIEQLNAEMVGALRQHAEVVRRLAEIPGVSLTAAQQIIAEVGVDARAFAAPQKLASWVGVCPGKQESAGKNYSNRSPKGNPMMRRLLTQCAWAAVKAKDTIFQEKFRRLTPRLGARQAIWAVAHQMLRIIWKILHEKVDYIEKGNHWADVDAKERRKKRFVKQLQRLGYSVQLVPRTPAVVEVHG